MTAGLVKPNFAQVRAPVLAFFATPPELPEFIARYSPASDDEHAALADKRAFDSAIVQRHISDLKKGVPKARIVVLSGANFYVFLPGSDELVREIRTFLAGI